MKNEYLISLSDKDLLSLLNACNQYDNSGVMANNDPLRKFYEDTFGDSYSTPIVMAQLLIYKECANRWQKSI